MGENVRVECTEYTIYSYIQLLFTFSKIQYVGYRQCGFERRAGKKGA